MVDALTAANVAAFETTAGRDELLSGTRPRDSEEPWRAYYVARNYFSLARRHGSSSWILAHLAYSARRIQKSRSRAERAAILEGSATVCAGNWGRTRPICERPVRSGAHMNRRPAPRRLGPRSQILPDLPDVFLAHLDLGHHDAERRGPDASKDL